MQSTTWRDEPVQPSDYGDLAGLVRLARQVRGRTVDFNWCLTREDLIRLRRAVYEWAHRSAGRYRLFDADVLSAINEALGERDSMFAANRPTERDSVEWSVSCTGSGDEFRFAGHAPFDVLVFYGSAELVPERSAYLGPTASILKTNVQSLGWDLDRLCRAECQPARNVLYGLKPDYGMSSVREAGPIIDLDVHFHGPFSAFDAEPVQCLFRHHIARTSGVYLWTVDVAGSAWPWYVGQTQRQFGIRMAEHVAAFLSGQYTTFDAAALAAGECVVAEPDIKGWFSFEQLPTYLGGYARDPSRALALLRLLRFHVAPLSGDAHLHNCVEGMIGRFYKGHADERVRSFFFPGVTFPAAIPHATRYRLWLSSDTPIAHLPPVLPRDGEASDGP